MKSAAKKEAGGSYILGAHDCTHVVKEALDAGGLKNGETTTRISAHPISAEMRETSSPNYLPENKQREIEGSNKGKDVDDELKRKK